MSKGLSSFLPRHSSPFYENEGLLVIRAPSNGARMILNAYDRPSLIQLYLGERHPHL